MICNDEVEIWYNDDNVSSPVAIFVLRNSISGLCGFGSLEKSVKILEEPLLRTEAALYGL